MIQRVDALQSLKEAGRQAWQPQAQVKLSEWVEERVRLSPEWEATPGKYDLTNNPFWREPLDSFLDPVVRQITIMKSTQVGGTLLLISAMLGLSELDPAPSMAVGPDELYCAEVRERTYATGSQTPGVRERIPPERLRNARHIDLGTARTYLAWAGSAQRLRGRACKRVFRSEIDVWPEETPRGGDTLKASSERVKRFIDSTIYDESSPDGDDSRIEQLYDAGHKARWKCQCPHCGAWQEVRFFTYRDGKLKGKGGVAGYKDENDNHLPSHIAAKQAHYICVNGCKITQDQKQEWIKTGKWVAAGQSITEDGKVIGEIESRRHLSYHIWSLMSPTITIADVVVAYLEHRRDARMRDFMQNWLGLKYETRRKLPEWHVLGKKLEGTHLASSVPREAWFITAGVDVQVDACYYVARAWGDAGTSWLVESGMLQRYDTEDVDFDSMTPDELNAFFRSDLRQIQDALVNRYFPVEEGVNPMGKDRLRPRLVGIDSQHRTREVHAFVHSQDERRVRAVRGDHKTKPQDRFRITTVERPSRGGPAYVAPRQVVNIYTPHFKEAIFERFLTPAGAPGSYLFHHGVVEKRADYLRQMTNERPTDVIDKTTGRKKTIWKPRSEQWGNHYWDAEVYAWCMAELLLHEIGATWDASTWSVAKNSETKAKRRRFGGEQASAAVRDDQVM